MASMTSTIEERLAAITPATDRMEAVKTIGLFLAELEKGAIRSAVRDEDGVWQPQTWVKEGILAAFRIGVRGGVRVGRAVVHRQGHDPGAALQGAGRHPHRARRLVDPPRRVHRAKAW